MNTINFFLTTATIFSSLLLFSPTFSQDTKAKGWSKTIRIQIDDKGYKIDTTYTTYSDEDVEKMLKDIEKNLDFDMDFNFHFKFPHIDLPHVEDSMFNFRFRFDDDMFDFPDFEEFERNLEEMLDELSEELSENNNIRKEIEKRIKIDTNTVNIDDKIIIKKGADADKNTLDIQIDSKDKKRTVTIKSHKEGKDTVITKSAKKVIIVNDDETIEVIGDDTSIPKNFRPLVDESVKIEKNSQLKQKKIIPTVCVKIYDLDRKDRENLKKKNLKFSKTEGIENLEFYPNPNTGRFTLSFSVNNKRDELIYYNPKKEKTVIRIIDINGKEIYTEDIGNFSGEYTKEIELQEKIPGTYILQITHGKRALTKKIIVE